MPKPPSSGAYLAAALVALLTLGGCATVVGYFILPREGIREVQYEVDVEHGVSFNTSDGVSLVSDIYRPRIKAPVLLMAGWFDPFLPTQLRDFETVRNEAQSAVARGSRLIIGPWTHADPVKFPDGSTAGDYRPASTSGRVGNGYFLPRAIGPGRRDWEESQQPITKAVCTTEHDLQERWQHGDLYHLLLRRKLHHQLAPSSS